MPVAYQLGTEKKDARARRRQRSPHSRGLHRSALRPFWARTHEFCFSLRTKPDSALAVTKNEDNRRPQLQGSNGEGSYDRRGNGATITERTGAPRHDTDADRNHATGDRSYERFFQVHDLVCRNEAAKARAFRLEGDSGGG